MTNHPIILRPVKEVIESVNRNPAQRNAIRTISFSGLLDLKCTQFPRDLRDWLLNNFNTETRALNIDGTKIIVTPEDVEKILGLPSRGLPVPIAGKTTKEIKSLFGGGKITTKNLKKSLLKLSGDDDEFVVKFVLFMIGSFLCAASGLGVNRRYLNALTNVRAIADMNWSKHILDFLCEGVKKSVGRPNKATHGCTFFLAIFYLEHMTPVSGARQLRVSRPAPKVGAWDDNTVIARWESLKTLEFDKKNKTVGFIVTPTVSSLGTTEVMGSMAKPKRTRIEDEKSCKKTKSLMDKSTNHFKDWSPRAMERAKEVQANLSPRHPSFIKVMQKTNVSHPFYMNLPSKLCLEHLPRRDGIVLLEVENGRKYKIKLHGVKWAFNDGWMEFSVAQKLLDDDILVFHLVAPFKFKVYIVRASVSAKVDKALTVIEFDDCAKEKELEKNITCETFKKHPSLVTQNIIGENSETRNSCMKNSDPKYCILSNLEDFGPSYLKNFEIIVHGATIELPQQVRGDYYELCRKSYLHESIIKGIGAELTASIISGTVNISKAIRESKISTNQEEINNWHKALDGFKAFGINVALMKGRLNRLSNFILISKRGKEAEIEVMYEKEARAPW